MKQDLEISVPFEVIATDISNRPEVIPTSKWLVKGRSYSVIKVEIMQAHGNQLGFTLAELDISEYFPYVNFGSWRFELPHHVLQLMMLEAQMSRQETKEETSVTIVV